MSVLYMLASKLSWASNNPIPWARHNSSWKFSFISWLSRFTWFSRLVRLSTFAFTIVAWFARFSWFVWLSRLVGFSRFLCSHLFLLLPIVLLARRGNSLELCS